MVNGGSEAMTKFERALLLGLAEEIVLQLRSRLAEIEQLHRGSRPLVLPHSRNVCGELKSS